MERTIKRAFRFALSACLISLLTACGGNKTSNTEVTPSIESSAYVHKKEAYKVACVGDSLTAGHMWANQAYPVYLEEYLKVTYSDINYEVKNCGVNGISITGYGGSWNNPNMRYIKQDVYKKTIDFHPDVICILLGTNDATGWAKAEPGFKSGYISLINNFKAALDYEVDFIIMTSPNTTGSNEFGIPGNTIVNNVVPIQKEIAEEEGIALLDVQNSFETYEGGLASLIRSDKVHLSVDGAKYLANLVGDAVYALEN